MLKQKVILMLLAVLTIGACGFQPLYVQRENDNIWYFGGKFNNSIADEMQKVKIEPIADRFGQLMRNHLLDSLTPKGAPSRPKYRLYVTLESKNVHLQALREDISATREMAIYKVNYYMMEGDKQLFKSDSVSYVSYDILNNPYSTTIAQKKAEKEAAKIIADDISLRIGAYFHSLITKQGSTSDI